MRVLTVEVDDYPVAAVRSEVDGNVHSLVDLGFVTLLDLIRAGPDAWAAARKLASSPGKHLYRDVKVLAPIPRTERDVFCVVLNYQSHWDEGRRPPGASMPLEPMFFTKPWTTLSGPGAIVPLDPAVSTKVDWEAEIAVIIGEAGINIPQDRALEHVFGYCMANDISARDLIFDQGANPQLFKAKSLDGYCPMGPWIATRDEITDPDCLEIDLWVNEVQKQHVCAREMIFRIPRIIERLSRGMRLLPGDVILTGTSSGVGLWHDPPLFLADGDNVRMQSEHLGELQFSAGLTNSSNA